MPQSNSRGLVDRHAWDTVRARFLLFQTRECGKDFVDDIKFNRQILGDHGGALQVQRWASRIIWS